MDFDFSCGFPSPPLILDPRAKTCAKCGMLLYPGQLCPDCYNFCEDTEDFEVHE